MSTPRGLRNFNPGNIELGDDQWQGLAPQQTDGRFAQFTDPVYGIRAMAKVLHNYQAKHGLNTARAMIGRWAPTVENDTESYVRSVASAAGIDPDAPLDMARDGDRFLAAMIQHENGQQPYDLGTIRKGMEMAGIQVAQADTGTMTDAAPSFSRAQLMEEAMRRGLIDRSALEAEAKRRGLIKDEPTGNAPPEGMTAQEAAEAALAGAQDEARMGWAGEQPGLARGAASFVAGIPFVGEYADEAFGLIDPRAQDRMRALQEHQSENNPAGDMLARGAGGVAGSLAALPGALAAPLPASLLGKAAAGLGLGSLLGGAEGAVSGYGSGTDDESRAENATDRGIIGAGVGGVVGGLAPLVGSAVGAGVRNISGRVDKAAARQVGASPEAVSVVGKMLEADGGAGRVGGGMLADAGPATAGLLDTAMQKAGPSARIAREAVENRANAASRDIGTALDDTLGAPAGVRGTAREIAESSAPARREAYEAFYSAPIDYASEAGRKIEGVLERVPPRILRDAVADANEEMVSLGLKNQQILADIAEDGAVTFREMPNARQLDALKQSLDKMGSEKDAFGRLTQGALRPRRLARELRDAVKGAGTGYDRALSLGGQKIAEDNALDIGRRMMTRRVSVEDVADALEGASPAELARAKSGVRSAIDEAMGNVRRALTDSNMDAREALQALRDLSSRNNRDKLSILLGDEAEDLFSRIDTATRAFELRASTSTNSRTFGRQSMDEAIKAATEPGIIGELLSGSPMASAQKLAQGLTRMTPEARLAAEQKIAGDIARLLTQQGPQAQATARRLVAMLARQPGTERLAQQVNQVVTAATAGGGYRLGEQLARP